MFQHVSTDLAETISSLVLALELPPFSAYPSPVYTRNCMKPLPGENTFQVHPSWKRNRLDEPIPLDLPSSSAIEKPASPCSDGESFRSMLDICIRGFLSPVVFIPFVEVTLTAEQETNV